MAEALQGISASESEQRLEIELKFRLDAAGPLISQLRSLGARPLGVCRQRDQYFNHPSRDFAVTDEAVRLRCTDDETCLTYKGPLLDKQTKTREEIELRLQGSDVSPAESSSPSKADDHQTHSGGSTDRAHHPGNLTAGGGAISVTETEATRLLVRLGFRPVREVVKTRELFACPFEGREFELAIDEVQGLGLFCEIELMADRREAAAAQSAVKAFASRLNLHNSERRGYLSLLIEMDEKARASS